MKPSSIACFMEYTWKGWNEPSVYSVPNISKVCPLGVAVKAKKENMWNFIV